MSAAPRIRPADPRARRGALAALVVTLVVGGALIGGRVWYNEPLAGWLLEDPALTASRGRLVLLGTGALVVIPLGVFAAYLWRLGTRVINSREFPPPGAAMLRDTEIVTGDAAISHGRGLKVLAIFLVLAIVALAATLWRVASVLTSRI